MNRMLYVLLLVVALAAAVLSFDALHGLAILCGFTPNLAPLLPVTVDAGAAAGSLVWLRGEAPATARRFARVLALVLLGGSVAGNALGHGLSAYSARPEWWVVVLVSAVPPAVLGAVVHLAVLAGRGVVQTEAPVAEPPQAAAELDQPEPDPDPLVIRAHELGITDAGRPTLVRELGISDYQAKKLQRQLGQPATNGSVLR